MRKAILVKWSCRNLIFRDMKCPLELQPSLVQYAYTLVRPCPSWLDRYKTAEADPLAKESLRDGYHEKAEVAKHTASSCIKFQITSRRPWSATVLLHKFSQVNAVCTRASASFHLLKASLRDLIQMMIDLVTLQIARLSNASGKNV